MKYIAQTIEKQITVILMLSSYIQKASSVATTGLYALKINHVISPGCSMIRLSRSVPAGVVLCPLWLPELCAFDNATDHGGGSDKQASSGV